MCASLLLFQETEHTFNKHQTPLTDKFIYRKKRMMRLAKLLTIPQFTKPTQLNLQDHQWEAQQKSPQFLLIVTLKFRL